MIIYQVSQRDACQVTIGVREVVSKRGWGLLWGVNYLGVSGCAVMMLFSAG